MHPLTEDANIVLIGMPGVGKRTVGVLLAKAARRQFIDTDVLIQAREGRSLQEIIDTDGIDQFCRMEQRHILDLDCRGHVIATGGSVVYSDAAMAHLKATGPVVHLDLPIELLAKRIDNLDVRGVVMARDQTLDDLFGRRDPLYRKWADITIDGQARTQDQIVAEILSRLQPPGRGGRRP